MSSTQAGLPVLGRSPWATNTDSLPARPRSDTEDHPSGAGSALLEWRHPVTIVTKGALILRDLDLLGELAAHGLVSVSVSITTLDNALKTQLEPRAASPSARLRIVRELAAADVPVGALMAPVIPVVNDGEIEAVVAEAAAAGAEFVGYVVLRLPFEVKDLFVEWLLEHHPLKAEHVMNRVRDLHGGKTCQAEWGARMRGQGVYADLIAKRFEIALGKHGLDKSPRRRALRTDLFRQRQRQGSLF